MANKIFDGNDIAAELGFADLNDMMLHLPEVRLGPRGQSIMPRWGGACSSSARPVAARIERGRWIADCECNGAEWVALTFPWFFCFGCGNTEFGGKARPVVFPAEKSALEHALMERPIIEPPEFLGISPITRALRSRPSLPLLTRAWMPGETVDVLRSQHEAAADLDRQMKAMTEEKSGGRHGL